MDNNTSYETQAIDLNLLSVLDITKEGKVVSVEKWVELWNLVFQHINKIDAFCVDMQSTLDNWHESEIALNEIIEDMQMKYDALSTEFIHYGENTPENPHIMLWVRRMNYISTHDFLTNADVDSELSSTSENPVQNKVINEALSGYVMSEVGKGLSSNDFTNEDKEKLSSALQNEDIDQTYSPTSTNAQSGKAVAEAVSTEQNRADNTFANALKGSKSGKTIEINDVSPLKHSLKIKCSMPTGTESTTVINETFSSDGEFSLPASSDSFHLHAGVGDSRNYSSSVFVPVVDGVPLTAASVPTNANPEVYITHNLDYSISGTTLTISGSWSYEQDGTHTTAVNKTVTVVAGSKLTGIALNGMSAGDTETCTLTVSTVQAIPTVVTVTAPDGTVSTGSASADGTVTGLNSTASPMTVSVSAGTVSVTYNRDISFCLGERANALVSQKSGSMLRIDDVSPCDNTVNVNVSAVGDNVPSKIYQFGRNILNPTPWTAPSTVYGVTYAYLPDEDCFLINGTAAANGGPRKVSPFYALGSGFIISLKYISGSVTIPAEPNKFASFHLGKADTTTESASNFFFCGLQNNDNTTAVIFCDKNYWQASWFFVSAGVVFENYKIRLQVERNNSATAYEHYTAPAELTPDADGNVTAARENVCTFAVKTPGTLSAKYNRDINKAFAELYAAIISLGGNV